MIEYTEADVVAFALLLIATAWIITGGKPPKW